MQQLGCNWLHTQNVQQEHLHLSEQQVLRTPSNIALMLGLLFHLPEPSQCFLLDVRWQSGCQEQYPSKISFQLFILFMSVEWGGRHMQRCVWRPEDSFWELVFFQIQGIKLRLSSLHIEPFGLISHLTSPVDLTFECLHVCMSVFTCVGAHVCQVCMGSQHQNSSSITLYLNLN